MALYDYQCDCGLRFEKSVRMSLRDDPVKCRCGKMAARAVPTEVSGVFRQKVKGGPVPQNTGVASFDAHVDRVIGASAGDGWKFQEGRDAVKRQVLRDNPGAANSDLSRNVDGTWEVMPGDVKQRTFRGRIINHRAMDSGRYINHDREQ